MALSFLGSTASTSLSRRLRHNIWTILTKATQRKDRGRPRFVRQAISRNILLRAPGELSLSPEWL